MDGSQGLEIRLCRGRFDFGHEGREPVGDRFDGGWERGISAVTAERFVGLACRVIASPCGRCERLVKKEYSFWRKVDVLVAGVRTRRDET